MVTYKGDDDFAVSDFKEDLVKYQTKKSHILDTGTSYGIRVNNFDEYLNVTDTMIENLILLIENDNKEEAIKMAKRLSHFISHD
jgi:hypothetical protein